MKNSISVYSTSNANGVEGQKRCIYEEILKDFKHIYALDYLVEFFEEKAQDCLDCKNFKGIF